ncbi:hypothetical protein GP486_005752 [Trichoglossum hirsutum]|uniref:Major facilitator superfamily (MFS) profile domain-containing protein n=1 Tax=Trichoglossum hirsutum TaxID=265104 RepID=A0A9P8L8K3_9PEZI|nr:hypothetical protein GP486_005752 [Trichoglossum hirsutum]
MEAGQSDGRTEVGSAEPVTSGIARGKGGEAHGGQQDGIDAEAEKRLVKKLDRRVVLLLAVLYLLSVLDRSNIGNARVAGMSASLHLTSTRYEWLLTAFYIAYIVFQWFVLMWKVIPAHIWAACTVLAWGIVATLQSTTTTFVGEVICRFLLGMAEAGFGPGVPYLLSFFYLRREIGFRVGLFLAAAPLANSFSGGLAYGITSRHSKLSSWRVLFLAEGLPSILMAPVAFFFLPDTPERATFLTAEEKAIARARGVQQVGEGARIGSIDWKHIRSAFCDIKNWLTAVWDEPKP